MSTTALSKGYFSGPDTNGSGSIVPYNWTTIGNWFINGPSMTGYPGGHTTAVLATPGSGMGYEVGVKANQFEAAAALKFDYAGSHNPAKYVQDLVIKITGDGRAHSAKIVTGSLDGNSSRDGYVFISKGGYLEVHGMASETVSVVFGTYSNAYDGSKTVVTQSGVNDNLLSIGQAGKTNYDYTRDFSAPIYGLIGADKVVLTELSYSASDTYTWYKDGGSSGGSTHKVIDAALGKVGTLDIYNSVGMEIASLHIALPTDHTSTTSAFMLASVNGELAIEDAACFQAGTRILTDRGEIAVEDLREGDLVVTASGQGATLKPVAWIGQRRVDLMTHRRPEMARPICIKRGAFGENLPARDLRVSPEHCVFTNGNLFQARFLVNGTTIVQDQTARSVRYFHVELDQHDLVLAEGMPAETYLDNGNRDMFSNAWTASILNPDIAVRDNLDTCMPMVFEGAELDATVRALAARAMELGYGRAFEQAA